MINFILVCVVVRSSGNNAPLLTKRGKHVELRLCCNLARNKKMSTCLHRTQSCETNMS